MCVPLLVAVVAGCSLVNPPTPAPPTYAVDIAGVVEERELVGQDFVFHLNGGRELTYASNANYLGGSQPTVGDLLLSGVQGERWVLRVTLRQEDPNLTPPGCYVLFGKATMSQTHVFQAVSDARGDVLLVLPKTRDWTDVGAIEGSNELAGVGTCVNSQGQAFHRTY